MGRITDHVRLPITPAALGGEAKADTAGTLTCLGERHTPMNDAIHKTLWRIPPSLQRI